MLDTLPLRGTDKHGSGYYGAPRGKRTHRGIDLCCYPKTSIDSPVNGVITKVGYPYADHLEYRYIQITDNAGCQHRLFYVEPLDGVGVSQRVREGGHLGMSQDLTLIYPGITNHIHYEVMDDRGNYLDPIQESHIYGYDETTTYAVPC